VPRQPITQFRELPRARKVRCFARGSSGSGTSHVLENSSRWVLLPPCTPASLSVVYSRIFRRASGGSCGDNNMRLTMAAERPEPSWLALRIVQVVLRASPSAFDCSSRVRNPASTRACPSSLILAACRAFISTATCNEPLVTGLSPFEMQRSPGCSTRASSNQCSISKP
jgi:hypothetical protein